ncbi:hypothetical protein H0H93_012926 [Arthromyces matolae]|nr:hypothetical protein H0H93_012926 [Arthromyces matolae]
MSPTFIRLTHFVLASLIAAGTIHLSSSFAEAAPTSLTNDLLPRDAVPPSVSSNFAIGLAIPTRIISSDSYVDCLLDPTNSRCGAPTLIRRADTVSNHDESQQIAEINNALASFFALRDSGDPAHITNRIEILNSLALGISRIMSNPKPSKDLNGTALAARLRLTEFVKSRRFQDLTPVMTTLQLKDLLTALGVMEPAAVPGGSISLHDPALTPIVLQLLQKNDPDKHLLCTADRIFLAANQIVNLLDNPKASLENSDPITGHGIYKPAEYLPTYHNWLVSQRYEPWPNVYEVDNVQRKHDSFQGEPRQLVLESIAGILLRYTRYVKWKPYGKSFLPDIKKRFNAQLDQDPPLPLEARVVIKAYLWTLPEE